MPKNELYKNDLIADDFKGLSHLEILERVEAIKIELCDIIQNQPKDFALIDFTLQRIIIGTDLTSKDFPQKSTEICVGDVKKLTTRDWFEFLFREDGDSMLKPVLKEFYMRSFNKINRKEVTYN
jgi:hypothetical protein